MTTYETAHAIAARFALPGQVQKAEPFHGGHINDSWRLTLREGARPRRYLLQRINPHVFPQAHLVMENFLRVTEHLAAVLAREGVPDAARRTLSLVPTREGAASYVDPAGAHWRLLPFIEGTTAFEQATDAGQAYKAGLAFGRFQRWLGDYRGPRLHETIPGFHDTPRRLAVLERAIESDPHGRAALARPEIEAALADRTLADALLSLHRRGDIPERVVHNDAKIANVLFDAASGEALCVVDLDTVMPGLALYDFGDMARSMVSLAAEDEPDLSKVTLRADLFEGVARGYLDGAGDLLSETEKRLLVTAARLITYEQALRFLTDFLTGDRYYRTTRPGHNLDRCRVQFTLLAALTRAETDLLARLDRR